MTMKKTLLRGFLGIPIGVFISTTIGLVISLIEGQLIVTPNIDVVTNPLTAYTTQYIISAVIGFVFALSSAIFEVDRWSLTKQTILHLIITSVVFLPCSILARWIEPDLLSIIIYFLVFILIYFIIWIIQYSTWKKRIEKLNKKLQNR